MAAPGAIALETMARALAGRPTPGVAATARNFTEEPMFTLTTPHQPPNRAAPESTAIARHLAGVAARQAIDEAPHCMPDADLAFPHAGAAGAIEAMAMQWATRHHSPHGLVSGPC